MSAGPRFEYFWADGECIKKPIKCSAPDYVAYLMDWVQGTLDDETIFPARVGTSGRSEENGAVVEEGRVRGTGRATGGGREKALREHSGRVKKRANQVDES